LSLELDTCKPVNVSLSESRLCTKSEPPEFSQ